VASRCFSSTRQTLYFAMNPPRPGRTTQSLEYNKSLIRFSNCIMRKYVFLLVLQDYA
jgi:hypothetical protein